MKTNKIKAPRQGGVRTVEGRGYEPIEAVRCVCTNCLKNHIIHTYIHTYY